MGTLCFRRPERVDRAKINFRSQEDPMQKLMTSTALVASIALSGAAAAQTAAPSMFLETAQEADIHASDLIGMRVYAAAPSTDGSMWDLREAAGLQTDWEDVGEINDLVLTREGDVSSVLVDIGGFLGIGERQIAMDMSSVRFVSDSDTEAEDDYFLVIPAARADLEAAPAYARDTMSDGEATAAAPMAGAGHSDMTLAADEIAVLTTEDLTGARVYDASGEWIGEVGQLILAENGTITAAIVDVGGFLGIGEKPVKLSMDQLQISRLDSDDGFRVSVPMTQDALEQLPTFEG
jgi:sporulation protein YlmC with PRC-barrel domain